MTPEQINTLRSNIINAPASIVANNRADMLAVCDEVDARLAAIGDQPGIDWQTVYGIGMGVRNAPDGIIYNEKLHLLQVFEALDILGDAIAKKRPGKEVISHE